MLLVQAMDRVVIVERGGSDAVPILAAALIAFAGVVATIGFQNWRERRNWLNDRRLSAYSRLAYTSSEVGSAASIFGEVGHNQPNAGIEVYLDAHTKFRDAHAAFNEAQHIAGLVAGRDMLEVVLRMSQSVHDLVDHARAASVKGDIRTGKINPGDPEALDRMNVESHNLINLRIAMLNAARREIRPVRRFWRGRAKVSGGAEDEDAPVAGGASNG